MSNGDKRTVATDALETLGTIIDETAARDAIHLAVEPAVAGEILHPGMHVRLFEGVAYEGQRSDGFGIVDPFLSRHVKIGERFWLVVYPRQITSLRHVWTHPSFPPAEVGPSAFEQNSKEKSEAWLKEFCRTHDCPGYWELIALVQRGPADWDNSYLHVAGSDAHGEIPPELYDHVETVTGEKLHYVERPTYFSCSC